MGILPKEWLSLSFKEKLIVRIKNLIFKEEMIKNLFFIKLKKALGIRVSPKTMSQVIREMYKIPTSPKKGINTN